MLLRVGIQFHLLVKRLEFDSPLKKDIKLNRETKLNVSEKNA